MFRRSWVLISLVALAATLAASAPAAGKTYRVTGRQVITDEAAGKSIVRGGLIGTWNLTGIVEDTDPATPLQGSGTEAFAGCLDRHRDRSCKGDPRGTFTLSFLYWATFDGDALIWGACYHPITGGSGAFAGAQGVFTFVDSPTPKGVKTRYVGTITLGAGRRAASASVAGGCGGH